VRDALGAVQSALVLGGGSEIAQAIAHRLVADRTRTVLLAGRAPERLEASAEAHRGPDAEVDKTLPFVAEDVDSHPEFVEDAFRHHGDVDLVLVAFGVLGSGTEDDPAAATAIARTNYLGAVSVMTAVVERLKRQGHGTLVVLSSVAGERVRKSNYVYGSSKAGLDAFAQGLGDSLQGSGVSVMVVRPGFVKTKMTEGMEPAPFATHPEAVADAVVGGLRKGSHTVWAPPIMRPIMSVLRHLPRPLFRRLNF